jgi:hypothetical protein
VVLQRLLAAAQPERYAASIIGKKPLKIYDFENKK